jgi:hypothetical protein
MSDNELPEGWRPAGRDEGLALQVEMISKLSEAVGQLRVRAAAMTDADQRRIAESILAANVESREAMIATALRQIASVVDRMAELEKALGPDDDSEGD